VAAAEALQSDPRPARRPALRLAPPYRRRRARRAYGDAVFATTLAAILAVGIIGVLLLNTSMQTQADRIAATQHRLAALRLAAQTTSTMMDELNSPGALAARAAALHLHPARTMPFVVASATMPRRLPPPVSARARAKTTSHAG
jgi:hypothetical protein